MPEAAPVVAITTTCGTGTEADQYSVITNEEMTEKLDFTTDAIFPVISIIDPELIESLPRDLTIYQGFDALFHAAECYVTNRHENRMVDLFAKESVKTVSDNLVKAAEDGSDIEARCNMAFAADILSGWCMTMVSTTSHHILAQTLGGMYPVFPHGACLISVCESYYTHACRLEPELFDELGEIMGVSRDPEKPGYAFVQALIDLMEKTDARYLKMSDYGVKEEDFRAIVDMTTHQVGIAWEHYKLSDDTFVEDEDWHRAAEAYTAFLAVNEDKHVLFLELGVGGNTPVIIKYPFWRMTFDNKKAVYACINHSEAYCPKEIEDRSICIDGDIGVVLETLA